MRYGMIRDILELPVSKRQEEQLLAAGCETVVLVGGGSLEAHSRMLGFLEKLRAGDTLTVCGLEAFYLPPRQMMRSLKNLLQTGVFLEVIGKNARISKITPSDDVIDLMDLISREEIRWLGRSGETDRPFGDLSAFQIDYAKRLRKQGISMRYIGQIFRLSPLDLERALRD
ncbi:hypothetical protein [Phenylobacterium immobile]|uniref:hypothetical protein n=1 Tax=Phenylobacterium immobile TaxID=21 RepID=UPI001C400E9B|nr:hypothetical protein [Phenylobacterium immobile]